ncbi:hypothetical protein EHS25_000836 [Saitozyma podzolica]|uniref:Major facilitator superfamily (MFS) profile domain-containing protein n=1 Tax=Saitozyma podzolica TaxID=1890683 RepID=A0A427YXE4_9TREE|nr:hypothetical protein EHS25_000836 [Saitozyma podzolica]
MSSGPLSAPSSPADALAPHQNVQQGLPELRELPPATTLKFHREHPLFDDLAPEEGYNHEGADLPASARRKWVNVQSNTETKRELAVVWEMFKADPLSPLTAYCRRYVIGGFGLFTEGYTLFSIGNLTALFSAVWPACWSKFTECNSNWVAAVTYLQIIGIIFGQIIVGIEGDWIGRKFGLVQDALVMTLGLVMLTASWGTTLNGWVICYAWSQFVYGLGVGGEYPMTSTTALESKRILHENAQKDDKLHRGRNVLFNQALLIILLLIFHGSGNPPYGATSAQWTFRVSFGIMALMTLWLAYYRYYKKVYQSSLLKRAKRHHHVNVSGYDVRSLKLVVSHFWGRLVGTCLGWCFNDFLFYGNKLFASTFIKIIDPAAASNVTTVWLWNLLNVGVEMVGYYLAALLIDYKFYGRKRMQIVGFLADGILFLICAIWFDQLESHAHIKGFQTIFFLSSFFQQFGPNCTTFLLAAEVFPISVRATAHGLSAASGKLGALMPAIIYNYVPSRTRFWIVCWFGFAGWLVTWVFIPDTTGLDLREQERYWDCVREGRAGDYHGIAVHPRHISVWERYILKRHRAYDPELDRQQRANELRTLWEQQKLLVKEGGRTEDELDYEDETVLSSKASSFFANQQAEAEE